ncbi:MAG: MFS transporter [Planctomycetaceae bacterium]
MNAGNSTPRSAWILLAFLTLLNIVNFVDRQLVTSLQIPLREDPTLQLTNVQNQLLAGYAFSVVYSVAGLLLGSLADRRHRPRLIAGGLFIWSIMTAASGMAMNFWQMALARVFVAIGEATLTPAAIAMLADVFRPQQRALATGLYYLGIPFGAGLSLIVANLLWPIPWIGWRGCFLALGLVGIVLVAALLWLHAPPRGGFERQLNPILHLDEVGSSPRDLMIQVANVFRNSPSLLMTMAGAVLVNIGVGATWLDSSWLHAERGFTRHGAPIFLGSILLFGGSLGNLLGGWLGDHFNQYRAGGRLLALVVLQLAVSPMAIAFRFLPGDRRVLLALCCFFGSILVTFMYGPVLATVQELTPLRLRATLVAILLIGLNILGASLGAVIAAWLAGRLESYTWGIFITGQAGLLSIPLFLLALRRYPADVVRLRGAKEET